MQTASVLHVVDVLCRGQDDICSVDYPERRARFDVVYHLLSPQQNACIRIKLVVDAEMTVPSCVEVYKGADWFEREAYMKDRLCS